MFSRLEPGALLNKVLLSVNTSAYDQHLLVNKTPYAPQTTPHTLTSVPLAALSSLDARPLSVP